MTSITTQPFTPAVPPTHEVQLCQPINSNAQQNKYSAEPPSEQQNTCCTICCCCCQCFAAIADCWARTTFSAWEWQQGREMNAHGAQNGNVGEQIGGQYLMYDSGGLFGLCFPRAQDTMAADVMEVNHEALSCCCAVIERVPACLSQTAECAGQVAGYVGEGIGAVAQVIECIANCIPD